MPCRAVPSLVPCRAVLCRAMPCRAVLCCAVPCRDPTWKGFNTEDDMRSEDDTLSEDEGYYSSSNEAKMLHRRSQCVDFSSDKSSPPKSADSMPLLSTDKSALAKLKKSFELPPEPPTTKKRCMASGICVETGRNLVL